MTLESSEMLKYDTNIWHLCTLVRGEVLRQFDTLSAEVEGATPVTLAYIILGLGTYGFPVNVMSKQKCTMRHGIRKTCALKVRFYAYCFVDLNEYLAVLLGAKISNKIWVTKLNEIALNSMSSSWSNQEYVQGFYCEYNNLKICKNVWAHINCRIYLWMCSRIFLLENILGKKTSVLVASVKWEEKEPRQILTLLQAIALASTRKNM